MPYRSEQGTDSFLEFIKSVLWLAFTIVIGLWLVSAWLTKIFVEHVLDPMTNQAFSRNDGLLIATSALVWGMIMPALLFPSMMADMSAAPPEEIWQVLAGTVLLGLAWGVSVGVKALVDLWLEVLDQPEPAYEPVQLLGKPIRTLPPPDDRQPPLPSIEELEAELEELFKKEKEEMQEKEEEKERV